MDLKQYYVRLWARFMYGTAMGSCEHENEP